MGWGGADRIRRFPASQEIPAGGNDRARGKHFQADLQGAAGHGAEMIFVGVWQRDARNDIAEADVEDHAEFVQDAGQRGAERNQLEDLALADELASAAV